MKKLALHWKIIIGLVLGIIWALLSSQLGWSEFTINWIAPFGKIFINLLKLIAVPLVLVSIISGVANIGDPSSLGRMGGKTLLAYLITTLFAVSMGLLLVNVIQPGKLIDEQSRIDNRISYEIWAASEGHEIKDGINYLQDPAFFERAQKITDLSKGELKDASVTEKMQTAEKTKESTPLQPLVDIVPENFFFSLT
ncbi:MAG: cation:dicarboxylase symporter family transporter, partial [Flavobacteriaceae bacterium]